MNLDQSMFTEGPDLIDTEVLNVDFLTVVGKVSALGGDDAIFSGFSGLENGIAFTVSKGATLDGGFGRNDVSGFDLLASNDGVDPINAIGIFNEGSILRFGNVSGSGKTGLRNLGTVELSRGNANNGDNRVSLIGSGTSGAGILNSGKIFLKSREPSEVGILGRSSGSVGIQNSGRITSGSLSDIFICESESAVDLLNQRTGIIDLGAGTDILVAATIVNDGKILMGLGNDLLELASDGLVGIGSSDDITGAPVTASGAVLRGSGAVDLGAGDDSFALSDKSGAGNMTSGVIGKVSGGVGDDTVVIQSGEFRFAKVSASVFRVFDSSNTAIADIQGFENVFSAEKDLVLPLSEGIF